MVALTGVVGVESELTVDAVASLTEAAGFSDGVAVVVEVDVRQLYLFPQLDLCCFQLKHSYLKSFVSPGQLEFVSRMILDFCIKVI